GLSPRHVDEIVMVIRTFPIRVGGNSGYLRDQITWDDVRKLSGAPEVVPEFTSVTKRMRRVAMFDIEAVVTASRYNCPTALAVMGIDRLDHSNRLATCLEEVNIKTKQFLQLVAKETG